MNDSGMWPNLKTDKAIYTLASNSHTERMQVQWTLVQLCVGTEPLMWTISGVQHYNATVSTIPIAECSGSNETVRLRCPRWEVSTVVQGAYHHGNCFSRFKQLAIPTAIPDAHTNWFIVQKQVLNCSWMSSHLPLLFNASSGNSPQDGRTVTGTLRPY